MIKVPDGIFDVPEQYQNSKVTFAIYQTDDSYGAVILDENCEALMDTEFEIKSGKG